MTIRWQQEQPPPAEPRAPLAPAPPSGSAPPGSPRQPPAAPPAQRSVPAARAQALEEQRHRALAQERMALGAAERQSLVKSVFDDVLGYGPIDNLLRDAGINEVMVNGPEHVYVERDGKMELTDIRFVDETHLRRIIDKIVSQVGRRVDEATPMVDARLPDGSRVNVVVHPLAIDGPLMSIRRFSRDKLMAPDLVDRKAMTPGMMELLEAAVKARLNIIVAGGTGSGK